MATGQIPGWVWIASLPYAILVTTVLFGKHIDKIEADTQEGRPDAAGASSASAARGVVAQGLMIAFYPIVVGAALVGWIGPWVALVAARPPAPRRGPAEFSKPRPETPPHSYVGWPLWFVGAAFIHTRRAGALLILGLLLNALLPVHLPWL